MKRLRSLTERRDLVDGGIVGGIVALGAVEIWLSGLSGGGQLQLTLALLVASLPLLARRRHPLAALVVVTASLPIATGVYQESNAVFAGLAVAIFSAAAYAPARPATAGLAFLLMVAFVGVAIEGKPTDILFIAVICGGIWGGGRLARAHQETAVAMAGRAELAESDREARARAAVAEERARIARELHDVVAHSVSVMVVQAGAERRALGDDRGETRDVLETIEQTGRQTLAELRRLLGMLRQSDDELALAPQPSMEYVDTLVEKVREAGMPVTLEVAGDRRPLPASVDLSAYRIVQEALTNALKHAGPASARVTIRYARDELELEIVDDGAGGVNGNGGGHGLIGMRERVTMFGGALDAGERSDGGYAVRARLPIAR